jgi:outer membrane protein assembly factor BamB/tRNA A-37 threonylcarbamoyl transferase component Bud32
MMSLLKKGGTSRESRLLHTAGVEAVSPLPNTSVTTKGGSAALRPITNSLHLLQSNMVLQNRYAVEAVLGTGGMSVVYRGRDLRFRDVVRTCAIKQMFQTRIHSESRLLRLKNFEREAGLLATLNHPAIPKVYDFFEEDDKIYLVMELIAGHDLQTLLDQANQPFDEQRVGTWALQICDVLHYLHSHKSDPIIFRDLKPSNIMVTPGDRIVVIDFGIARVFEEQHFKGTVIGSEGYAPPEQYRGRADVCGDVYALGATLHQLLTKSDPRFETPFTFHERPVRDFNPAVSDEMEALVSRMLSYDPEQRPQSIIKVKAHLQSLPALQGIAAAGEGMEQLQISSPQLNTGQSTQLLWRFACEDEVRSSPCIRDGVLYIGSYDTHLYAIDACKGDLRWKRATKGGISSSPVTWGDLVFVGSEDGNLYALDARKGTPRWNLHMGRAVRSSPRLSERIIYVGSDDQHVYAVDSSNGRVLWKYRTWMPVRSSCGIGDGFLVIGSSDGHAYALDLLKGSLQWKYRTMQGIISSPLVYGDLVLLGSMDANIYALSTENGWPVWRFRTSHYVNASPVVADGHVFVGSVDGNLYALEVKTGKLVWKQDCGDQIASSVSFANGKVYVGVIDGTLRCLDSATGQLLWKYQTGAPVVSSPAVNSDAVYVGSLDRHVYALKA